jgi:hypothetical protein
MRLRSLAIAVALAGLAFSLPSVWTARAATLICCADADDCPGGDRCCDPEMIGEAPCAPGRSGWCQETCTRTSIEDSNPTLRDRDLR